MCVYSMNCFILSFGIQTFLLLICATSLWTAKPDNSSAFSLILFISAEFFCLHHPLASKVAISFSIFLFLGSLWMVWQWTHESHWFLDIVSVLQCNSPFLYSSFIYKLLKWFIHVWNCDLIGFLLGWTTSLSALLCSFSLWNVLKLIICKYYTVMVKRK